MSVVNFWTNFKRHDINIDFCVKSITVIADKSKELFKTFQELDSLKIFKDYCLYFQFAIIQQHVLNDSVSYETYLTKMKGIIELNRTYQKNFNNQNSFKDSENQLFVIVDANGENFGKFILMND